MSIYQSYLTFDGDEDTKRPIRYEGSHVLPHSKSKRAGELGIAAIPSHITRNGKDDAPEGRWHPWLRVHIQAVGDNTVVLTKDQVEELRDALTKWLEQQISFSLNGETASGKLEAAFVGGTA